MRTGDFTVVGNSGFIHVFSVDLGGCLDTLKYLIDEKGSDFTVTDNKGHNTPLHLMIT
jgi:hypothetical protein